MLDRIRQSRYAFPAAILAIAAIAGIVVLIAQSGGDDGGGSDETATCEQVSAPAPKEVSGLKRPKERLPGGRTYTATVATNCGTFAFELDVEEAPRTAASFVALARDGFYDGLGFHRIAPGFVIQGGDPAGDGSGGPGYSVEEAPSESLKYEEGVVAMAKTGAEPAGTSGSQFFVVTAEDAQLPPDYALLGKVTSGQDVVDKIGVVETDPSTEAPVEPVVITSVKVSAQ